MASTIDYAWNDASQLTSVSDADSAYAYTYDDIGRVLTVSNYGTTGVPTVVLTSAYDAASNRTKLTSTIGGRADFENDYSFDNLNRLTRVDQIGQGGGNTVASKRVDFAYDDASRLTSIIRNYKPSGSWVEVATTALSYDNINRLTGIDHKQGGSSLFTAYSYTFDNANRITGITSQDGTVDYTYDATSQITSADYSYQTDESFTWDANGNRDDTGYTTGANNKMTSDGVYNYSYDHEGNLVLRVKISDSSRTEYTWDYRNRLTNVTTRATEFGAATMTVDYVYDVYDRRITKSYDADGAGGGSAVTSHFVFDGTDNAQVILQFDDSNNLTHRNLWALDQIFADEDSGNDILWSLGDNLGTVRDVIDSTGSVQNHLTYSAFGAVTSETASAVDFLMGFAGMVRDEETGASYAWHRYTQAGRWLNEDPIGFAAGDMNIGRVTANSPIDRRDPMGLFEERDITKLTDASRDEYYTRARRINERLWSEGRLTYDEAIVRNAIVFYSLHSPFTFNLDGSRNLEYWVRAGGPRGAFVIRPDRNPGDAIMDPWRTGGYATGCYQVVELLQLRGLLWYSNYYRNLTGDSRYRDSFDILLRNQRPSDVMRHFRTVELRHFTAADYLPGDMAWMENPYFYRLSPDEQDDFGGEEGATVIAIGDGLFVSYLGTEVYNTRGLQRYIYYGFDSVPTTANLSEFTFGERGTTVLPPVVIPSTRFPSPISSPSR